jgi:hypothetical protein
MKALKIAFFPGGAFVIFIIIYTLVDVFHCAHIAATKTQMLSNLKQIGIATLLYREDNDSSYPHATAMPGHRASIFPYLKNAKILQPQKDITTEYTFNFNLAGAAAESKPLGYPKAFDTSNVTAYYSFITNKELKGEVIQAYMDTHVKTTTRAKLFTNFQYQFDRTNITLAPPEYLADQDPLK